MPKPLVIVESPAKAKTISTLLGADYQVESSIGHIRDLPRNAADVPAAYKSEAWARRLGVDVDNDFKPLYVVSREKRDQVRKLKALVKDASELYLATDEDREGESIAWHLLEVLAPRIPVRRMVFHEITPAAIRRAVREFRDLDRRLVDAQETRRILDRLYGFEVSPVLWKKVMPALSAGRVQSVATRLVVERERARMRFVSASFWDLSGQFTKEQPLGEKTPDQPFDASLVSLDGRRLVTGRDFGEDGRVKADQVVRLDEEGARGLAARLESASFEVRSVEERPWRRTPHAPFMTSTLQQEAGRKLRFSAARTMAVAQDLYEAGYITYMRTDSTTLSEEALQAARTTARSLYGEAYLPERPRRYDKKVKNAQEAHEAIRPAGDTFRTPGETGLHGDRRRLYELVWMRTVASQMADAVGQSVVVRLGGVSSAGEDAEFGTSGRVITFPGFLRAYVEGADDPDAELEDREVRLPQLAVGDPLSALSLTADGHSTQPPARYTEASLVKALEEMGVGRPSTYATILDTIEQRGYIWKKGSALVPSWTAFAVTGLLERYFGDLVDYGFTAAMEEDLDEIARGGQEGVPWLSRFYFGNGQPGLKRMVSDHLGEIDAREINSIPIGGSDSALVVRVGRYGPYLQRGDDERAPLPEDLAPDELTLDRAAELLAAGSTERQLGVHPESGGSIVVRAGRFGPYVQVGSADETATSPGTAGGRPATASLLRSMDPATVTLEDALRVLSLPRVVGVDPATGEDIVASNGRYGPYLRRGSESRSLQAEEDLFTIGLDAALALFAQPPARRGRGAAAAPLRELGPDPESGGTILLREGRFGPYVTDGTTNASLRKGDTVDGITPERAIELLADRRAAGPRPARGRRHQESARRHQESARRHQEGRRRHQESCRHSQEVDGHSQKGGCEDCRDHPEGIYDHHEVGRYHQETGHHPEGCAGRSRDPETGGRLTTRGRFIVLEGGEATGKSTQAERLAAALGAILTREPGGTATGERIRALLLDPDLPPLAARAETLLLLAARAQHVADVIRPALEGGRDVVCDRFSGSTLAYQGYGRGLDPGQLARLSLWASEGIDPDRVILLQVDSSVALARRAERLSDRMEGEGSQFFSRVQAGYTALAAADPARWRVVDGSGPIDEVARLVADAAAA